jgi:hypothetical protein
MILTNAWLQIGTEPPFTCVRIPVRNDPVPQVNVNGFGSIDDPNWIDFPKDGPRPGIKEDAYGRPVAGIASDWK